MGLSFNVSRMRFLDNLQLGTLSRTGQKVNAIGSPPHKFNFQPPEMEPQAATPAPAATKTTAAAGPLGAYERWFNVHTGIARNMETMLYIAPQLVPVRS